jgi:hypothetical protein
MGGENSGGGREYFLRLSQWNGKDRGQRVRVRTKGCYSADLAYRIGVVSGGNLRGIESDR